MCKTKEKKRGVFYQLFQSSKFQALSIKQDNSPSTLYFILTRLHKEFCNQTNESNVPLIMKNRKLKIC